MSLFIYFLLLFLFIFGGYTTFQMFGLIISFKFRQICRNIMSTTFLVTNLRHFSQRFEKQLKFQRIMKLYQLINVDNILIVENPSILWSASLVRKVKEEKHFPTTPSPPLLPPLFKMAGQLSRLTHFLYTFALYREYCQAAI